MFCLPAGSLPLEGQDESNPILFQDDTVSQFRAFLFYSYSSPNQLQINRASEADMDRLLNLIQFAHKYLLRDCLLWALESLEHLLNSAAAISESQCLIIFHTTNLCASLHPLACARISELLKGKWIDHIKADPLRIIPAIDLAESLGYKSFLVALYNAVLETLDVPGEPGRSLIDGPLSGLSTAHLLRIFSGRWFLIRSFKNFQDIVPDVHLPTCPPNSVCRSDFSEIWSIHMGSHDEEPSDSAHVFRVIGEAKAAIIEDSTTGGSVSCPVDAAIDAAIATFNTAIVDNHFVLKT
ncbi:hypothetical protein DFH06DRAFT_527273 [Mycena polygramma]|nr:hypothetical protein DFH06DRAFT_527273 [Mycena polygramma]